MKYIIVLDLHDALRIRIALNPGVSDRRVP